MSLVVCAGCSRHVRSSATVCPFCDAPKEATDAPATPMRAPSRAGIVLGVTVGAVAASAAVFGTACSAYGGPSVVDAGTDSGGATDTGAALDTGATADTGATDQ